MSLPSAIGTMPHASATAAPPLLPPQVLPTIPRIARRAEHAVEGLRSGAELRRVGLADRHRACGAHARDDQRVARRDVVLVEQRAAGRANAGGVDQVLVRDRQAVQRPAVSPRASASSARAASASARSATSVTMALTRGFTRSMRARWARMTSTADTSLRRRRAARSTASRSHRPSPLIGRGLRRSAGCRRAGATGAVAWRRRARPRRRSRHVVATAPSPRVCANARRVSGIGGLSCPAQLSVKNGPRPAGALS